MRIGKPLEAMTTAVESMGTARGGDAKGFFPKTSKGSDATGARASDKRAEARSPSPEKKGGERGRPAERLQKLGRERQEAAREKRGDAGREKAADGGNKKAAAAERMHAARKNSERSEHEKELREFHRKEATKTSIKKAEYMFDVEERRRKREASAKA